MSYYYGTEKKDRVQMGMYFSSQLRFHGVQKFMLSLKWNKIWQASNCNSSDEHVGKFLKIKSSPYIGLIPSPCRIESVFFSSNLLMTNRFQHFKQTGMKKRNIYLRTNSFPYFMYIAVDIVNILLYKCIYFYASMCKDAVPKSVNR